MTLAQIDKLFAETLTGEYDDDAPWEAVGKRRVSTTLRHMLTEFSEFFHVSWTGLLIHASVGTAGGLGALRTKRSG